LSSQYICETLLGTGGFATVFRARHKTAPVRVAIKMIDKDRLSSESHRTALAREKSLLKRMNHPFIAKFFFFVDQEGSVGLAEELAPHGSLLQRVAENGPIPETQLRLYFMQLVSVLDYLHNVRKVAHRDIKLENILLDASNNIKVIDFGLSRAFSDDEFFTTLCGSPPYVSPELLGTGVCTPAADIWALGVVLYACACGRFPFYDANVGTLYRKITTEEIHYPMVLSDNLINLLKGMLCRDPVNRFTIAQIIEHAWFPTRQYAVLNNTISMIFGFDDIMPEIDEDIIAEMGLDEIESCDLSRAIEARE
jgi:serine/threonine protein kinase